MSDALHPEHTSGTSTTAHDGSTESLAAIGDVLGAVIDGGFELTPVLEKIAERSAHLCRAETGYVYLRDGDVFRLMADSGVAADVSQYEREHPIPVGPETGVGRVALSRGPVHIHDVLADPEYSWREGQRLSGYRTILGLPIIIDDDVIGVVGLGRNHVDPFDDEEIATISVFAGQTGVAVRLAGLMGEKHEAAEREAAVGQRPPRSWAARPSISRMSSMPCSQTPLRCATPTSATSSATSPSRGVYRIAAILGFNSGISRSFEESIDYVADRGTQ